MKHYFKHLTDVLVDPEWTVGYGCSKWRKEIQAEDINLKVICLEMVFKAIKLGESIKGINVGRKKIVSRKKLSATSMLMRITLCIIVIQMLLS